MSGENVKEKRVSNTVSFLEITNPEIFTIEGRPGGAVPIKKLHLKENIKKRPKDEKNSNIPIEEKSSRHFRVQHAIDQIESSCSHHVCSPLKGAMYMFSVAISGIIMLAANHQDMPEEYTVWTKNCLEGIRDEYGNHPPNVQGILNHLRYLNKSKSKGDGADGEDSAMGKSGGKDGEDLEDKRKGQGEDDDGNDKTDSKGQREDDDGNTGMDGENDDNNTGMNGENDDSKSVERTSDARDQNNADDNNVGYNSHKTVISTTRVRLPSQDMDL